MKIPEQLMSERILIMDGAMGTMIQTYDLGEPDYHFDACLSGKIDAELKGNNECLNLSHPEIIEEIHRAYIDAGADIIETNSFSANRISQQEYGLENMAAKMAFEAARIARKAADSYANNAGSQPRKIWVAGSMGPTGKSLSLASDMEHPQERAIDFDNMASAYAEQIQALVDGGVDVLLLETCFDALNTKAALYAASKVAPQMPVMISVALSDRSGRTLTGQTLKAFYTSVKHAPLLSFGLNCSLGAADMSRHIQAVAQFAECPVSFYPNAGLPDETGSYSDTPEVMAAQIAEIAKGSILNIVGGCCGTTPAHIAAIKMAVEGLKPRALHADTLDNRTDYPSEDSHVATALTVSGLECITINKSRNNFTNVGERTNVAGSRKFARLIAEGAYDQALQVAADQIEGGAGIIDVNMDDAMLDSALKMKEFLRCISNDPAVAKAAIMVDSSDFGTVVQGLKNAQGKCIVNSISLKEGEEVFLSHAREIQALGAAVIVMAFDEEGQATTYERKIEICSRAFHLLTEKLGFKPSDIIFDVNVLSVGTGIAEHRRYGVDFIEAVRWIKRNLPGALTSGGISNLSFAFRGNNAVREAMHSAFLYHACAAGLDMGIVNPTMLRPYDDIEPGLLKAVEDVILDRSDDATDALIALAAQIAGQSDKATQGASSNAAAPGEQDARTRLVHDLVSGSSASLERDVLETLDLEGSAVKVAEGPLMQGMSRVGEMFADGRMFLPQVVKAAKVMHDAVRILEPYMSAVSNSDGMSSRPKVLIATVKGDVHDIGKNITAIVLRCNGFDVTDLGVMVPSETILAKAEEIHADIIAVSGLITPSLARMEELCSMMAARGMTTPLFIGGATTSALHTALKLATVYDHVFYGPDASASAVMANRYMMDSVLFESEEHERQQALREQYRSRKDGGRTDLNKPTGTGLAGRTETTPATLESLGANEARIKPSFSRPADLPCHELSLDELMPHFDWRMLYAIWGFKYGKLPQKGSQQELELESLRLDAERTLQEMREHHSCIARIAASFMDARQDGDNIVTDSIVLPMMRQMDGRKLCLADYAQPYIGFFAISVHRSSGHGPGCDCAGCRGADDYESMMERSVRMTLAEAASNWLDEYLTAQLPKGVKICKPAAGYSSLPDHTLKRDILPLLPGYENLQISFTESYAMIPDASICGLVFMHPDACYPEIKKTNREAIADYAKRRGLTENECRIFLGHLV